MHTSGKHLWFKVALFVLATGSGTAHANLIINGGFEQPAFAGNGDKYSDSGLTSLTGWTFPTAPNSFFLEHGTPFPGTVRYNSGTQAVCLNYDGNTNLAPLSQAFATAAGQAYLLTFAMNEENIAHLNSPTLLNINVGSLTRTIGLDNPADGGVALGNGYKLFTLGFTALSASTTLSFKDVTPGTTIIHSTFLDDVSVVAVSPSASAPEPVTWVGLAGAAMIQAMARFGRRRPVAVAP